MMRPDLSVARAHELLDALTLHNDGANVPQLLELVCGIADSENVLANEVKKNLYARTSDFETHFAAYMDKLLAA